MKESDARGEVVWCTPALENIREARERIREREEKFFVQKGS